jgi:hypothetical protein
MLDPSPTEESPRKWSPFEKQQFVTYFLRRHYEGQALFNPIEIWSLGIVKTMDQCNEKIKRWRSEFLKEQSKADSPNLVVTFPNFLAKKFGLKCDRCGLEEPTGKPLESELQLTVENLMQIPESALLCEACEAHITQVFRPPMTFFRRFAIPIRFESHF